MRWNHYIDAEQELLNDFFNNIGAVSRDKSIDENLWHERFMSHAAEGELDKGKFVVVDLEAVDAINYLIKKNEIESSVYRIMVTFTLRSGHQIHFTRDLPKEDIATYGIYIHANWIACQSRG